MTVEIEAALRAKCADDPRLGLLAAQWEFDRQLVAQALQSVATTFPHYSRHDVSHSTTILVQITRLLGPDRIARLSATDLWLLLEAAYWHDTGMVVTDAQARQWWSHEAFRAHLARLKDGDDPTLARAASELLEDPSRIEASDTWPLDVRRAATLLLADFARGRHPIQSRRFVSDPTEIGLASPRVLIPRRLWEWLARITEAHGASQDAVMRLSREENGLGTDTCHPRFIAFLLRLGDLLDLDGGRFCPTLVKSIGRLPESSMDHVGKHASIDLFFVSPERIEVGAMCRVDESDDEVDPYGAYEAVSSWFDWLKDEVRFVAAHWAQTAPPDFGGAPSLGRVEAKLEGYIWLEEGHRPKFSVDEGAFVKLVQSNNLYGSPNAWVRELITNAEDASLLRLAQERPELFAKLEGTEPVVEPHGEVRGALSARPIRLSIDRIPGTPRWRVTLIDRGTGISRDDLKYMLTIGSSRKNPKRRRIVMGMPEHLRPTGSFGIGLQSAFMVTDEVEICSTHHLTRDRLRIVLRQTGPNARAGASNDRRRLGAYIEELPAGAEPTEPGVIMTFEIAPDEEAKRLIALVRTEQNPPDPIAVERRGALADVHAEVERLSESLLAPLELTIDGHHSELGGPRSSRGFSALDPVTSCKVTFGEMTWEANVVDLRYKGAPVDIHFLRPTPLISIQFDAEFGAASEMLTASRERLTPRGEQAVEERFFDALRRVLPAYAASLPNAEAGVPVEHLAVTRVALFTWLYLSARDASSLPAACSAIPLFDGAGVPVTLGELANRHSALVAFPVAAALELSGTERFEPDPVGVDDESPLQISGRFISPFQSWRHGWVHRVLFALFSRVTLVGRFGREDVYRVARAPSVGVAPPLFERLVGGLTVSDARDGRFVLPAPSDARALAIDVSDGAPTWMDAGRWCCRELVVLPVRVEIDHHQTVVTLTASSLLDYVEWLAEHPNRVEVTSREERYHAAVGMVRRVRDHLSGALFRIDFDTDVVAAEAFARLFG